MAIWSEIIWKHCTGIRNKISTGSRAVGTDENMVTIKVAELSFKSDRHFSWQNDLVWKVRLAAQTQTLDLEQLSTFHTLVDSRKNTEFDALLAFLRPFFTPKEWSVAELNSHLALFQLNPDSRKMEQEIIQKLELLSNFSDVKETNLR